MHLIADKGQVNRVAGGPITNAGGDDLGVLVETLAAHRTVKIYESQDIHFDPNGGAYNVLLPKIIAPHHRERRGLWFVIKNTGSSGTLPVKDAAGNAIVTLAINQTGRFVSNGTTWKYTVWDSSGNVLSSYLPLAGGTMVDAANIALATGNGTKIGTAVNQKLGFWNATPVVQPSGAAQAAITNSTNGAANGVMSIVNSTNAADVSSVINKNFTELWTLQNAIRTALIAAGIIKGAA